MTDNEKKIEIIKKLIEDANTEIEKQQNNVRTLQKEWIELLSIKVGDKVKVTSKIPSWMCKKGEPQYTEKIGQVDSITISKYTNEPQYEIYPFNKDGTVAKVGVFHQGGGVIEKLTDNDNQ